MRLGRLCESLDREVRGGSLSFRDGGRQRVFRMVMVKKGCNTRVVFELRRDAKRAK